ncbi:DUF4124 domain-containing protein [Ramlibacter sp. AN1133]|uniref:DUF4124 domain-containing protein n=1 Tax=Ramlibacter sp. AN1133 TaxID=3133429 RepID=UPI0030BC5D09
MKPSVVTSLALGILVAAHTAHAQVFKCAGPDGKITYSQAPCAGAGQLLDARKPSAVPPGELTQRREVERARRGQAAENEPTPDRGSVQEQRPSCLDDREVRNVEAAASSILLDALDREVHGEQVRRARSCRPLMTAAEMQMRKEELRAQRRASRAPAPAAPTQGAAGPVFSSCDGGGCWGWDGSRYTDSAGGNFTRQDGAFCVRSGDALSCR